MKLNSSLVLIVFMLVFVSAACGGGSKDMNTSPESSSDKAPVALSTEDTSSTSPMKKEETTTGVLEINELDPCKLVDKEKAETALGKSVGDAIVAKDDVQTSCTYMAGGGETLVTVSTRDKAGAKSFLLSDIAALQDECEVIWLNTWAGEPALAPDVEALRSETVLDLFITDLELQESCGLTYQQLTDLGGNAYHFMPFFGVTIGVATDDALVTFLLSDASMSADAQMDAAKELVRLALSE